MTTVMYSVPSPAEITRAKALQRDEDKLIYKMLAQQGHKDLAPNTVSKFKAKRGISSATSILLGALLGGVAGGFIGHKVGYGQSKALADFLNQRVAERNASAKRWNSDLPEGWSPEKIDNTVYSPSGRQGAVMGAVLGAMSGAALGTAPDLVGYIAGKISNKSTKQLTDEYVQASRSGIKLPGTYTYLSSALNDRLAATPDILPARQVI